MSHRILVIDHHPQGLERVVGPLRGAGYEVAIARTAADGASSFGHFEPDLVFIAARLPRTHGTVLCRELKRTDAGTQTPIVLIVEGTGVQIDLPPLDQFGADRLLQKPVSPEELLTVCCELLQPVGQTAGPENQDDAGQGVNYPDDGLNTALEELDALEFDLPENFLRGAPGEAAAMNAVPISNDHGEDIENHIDHLFGGDPAAPPSAVEEPTPSTGQDLDANEAVLEELDLDKELNINLSRSVEPAPPRRRASDRQSPRRATRQPAPPPPASSASSATLEPQRPAPESSPVVGRFQTEALTRRSDAPRAAPTVKDTASVPPRWIWRAIPVTVAFVALGVFFMSRPWSPPPVVPAEPVESTGSGRTPTGTTPFLSLLSVPTDSVDASVEPAEEPGFDAEAAAPAADAEPILPPEPARVEARHRTAPAPATAPVETRRRPEPTPVLSTPEPEPRRSPVATPQQPDPEPEAEPEVVEMETSRALPIDEGGALEQPIDAEASASFDTGSEPVVDPQGDATPGEPFAEAEAEPEPEPVPVTRDAVLLQRVEPRVADRDLKNGGGIVILKVRVGKNGAVSRVIVEQGLPRSPTLEGAAVAAVLRWRFEPALDAGEPVESWVTARFPFGE